MRPIRLSLRAFGPYVNEQVLDFRILKDRSLFLIHGPTGAGKTTIISLLCRFYDVQKGSILIDGIDIREYDVKFLRSHFGIVLQDVFLFAGDIESNIRLSNTDMPQERIVKAAKDVNLDRFIQQLPDKYKEEVKERGSTLSVGQKQLLLKFAKLKIL